MNELPPPLPPTAVKSDSLRSLLAILLSLGLGLFLADAVVSLADDSLMGSSEVRMAGLSSIASAEQNHLSRIFHARYESMFYANILKSRTPLPRQGY